MKISGKVKINNKWIDNRIDESKYEFEDRGNVAFGSLSWRDVKKGKNGQKDEFTSTTKRFVSFNTDTIRIIKDSLGNFINIEGKLLGSQYTNKEGVREKSEQIVVDKAEPLEGSHKSHPKESNSSIENDDEIPF